MKKEADPRLTEVFTCLNLSDFPALQEHTSTIKRLASSPNSTMQEIMDVCQKDFGLTAKLLREANSSYYSQTRPIFSVPAAAGRLGLSSIISHLCGITVLEDVVDMLGEKEIIPQVSKSFLSACFARTVCSTKKYAFHPDEAFVCSLLHKMGKLAALLFLPDRHRKVVGLIKSGASEDKAARQVFYGLSFSELGMELGRFWNFSAQIVSSMQPWPPSPHGVNDSDGILQCLSSLSNAFVEAVCESGRTNILFDRYGKALSLQKEEALNMLEQSLAEAKNSGKAYRQCLLGYKVSGKIRRMENLLSGSIRKKPGRKREAKIIEEENDNGNTLHSGQVKQFLDQLNQAIKEKVNFADFAELVLESLCKGIALDRVLLTSIETAPFGLYLKGRFGAGDILTDQVHDFRYPLKDPGDIFFNALTLRRDTTITVGPQTAMASSVKKLFLGHFLSILILYEERVPVGLLILDRNPGRSQLSKTHMKVAIAFRDLLMLGFSKDCEHA